MYDGEDTTITPPVTDAPEETTETVEAPQADAAEEAADAETPAQA